VVSKLAGIRARISVVSTATDGIGVPFTRAVLVEMKFVPVR
jgi:hypothetical protein